MQHHRFFQENRFSPNRKGLKKAGVERGEMKKIRGTKRETKIWGEKLFE